MSSENNADASPRAKSFTSRVLLGRPVIPGMAAWLVRKAVIKNLSQAKKIIVGLVVFDFVAAAIITYFFIFR